MVRRIPLSGKHGAGRYALVDDADYEWLSQFRWHFAARPNAANVHQGYAARGKRVGDKWTLVLMHRQILGLAADEKTDHVDGNGLNNTRKNLRVATVAQNNLNKAKRGMWAGKPPRSQYKGVYFNSSPGRRKRWTAEIFINGSRRHLGYFHTEVEAARVYDTAAREAYGEFARLNFPDN